MKLSKSPTREFKNGGLCCALLFGLVVVLYLLLGYFIGYFWAFTIPFVIFIIFAIFIGTVGKSKQQLIDDWFASQKSIKDFYDLSPREFEEFIAELYSKLGYES